MHCGMGPTASCKVLRACDVFGGWPAGQIKQKPSCGYRRSCPKAVSSWVRVPQQLLVHGMLVVCTPYHHVVYAIPNPWVLKSTIHSPSPHAAATVLPDCLTAVATAAAAVATAAAAVAPIAIEHRRMVRAVLDVLWCRPVGRVGTVATGDLIQKAGAGSGAQAARSGLAAAAAAAAAVASVVTAVTVIA